MAPKAQSEPAAEAIGLGLGAPQGSALPQGQWVVQRPEPGLARGSYTWPDWGVALLGSVLVAAGLFYLMVKLRRAVKR